MNRWDEFIEPPELPKFDEVTLERFDAVARTVFANETLVSLGNLELRHFIDERICGLVYELRAHLASEKLSRIDVKYPKDWWQAFKEHWFPKWLLKRYPVQYHEEHYDVRAFYPKVSLPQEQHYVRIIKTL